MKLRLLMKATKSAESSGKIKHVDSVLLSCRGHQKVFEAWFLLVQCAHWVQAAGQLLGTSGPEDCGPLLWLLTFYHYPTNRGHQRAIQLVRFSLKREITLIYLVFIHVF